MASYKIDVIQRLGKYHMAIWEATGPKPTLTDTPSIASLEDVVKAVESQLEEKGIVDKKDSVTFRGIAYEDQRGLLFEIRRATY